MALDSSIFSGLNGPQRRAVETTDGPLLILAGPGSGKTRVITHRIAYLIEAGAARPSNILAVTFTNKAAREMLERLQRLLGSQAQYLTMGTFHAISSRILRREGDAIGVPARFTIADDEDQIRLVKRALHDLNIDDKRFPPRALLSRISSAKSELIGPEQFAQEATSYLEEVVSKVYVAYDAALRLGAMQDFDDLLVNLVRLFRARPEVLERYQERYTHVLVDEFQDTNVAQYEIVKLLGAKHRNVCVVGDEDQSVYSWRHADIRNIRNFRSDFPEAQVILLEQNYRSTRTILDAASTVIAANEQRTDKRLWTENEAGERIVVHEADDEEEEASFVATQLARLQGSGQFHYADMAVTYRTNSQSRALERALLRHRIPHKVIGVRFYERKEVKDLLAYLRLIYNPADHASLVRIINVPGRGIGDKTLADLDRWAKALRMGSFDAIGLLQGEESYPVPSPFSGRAEAALVEFYRLIASLQADAGRLTVDQLLEAVIKRTNYQEMLLDGSEEGEQRWENVRELLTVAQQFAHLEPEESLQGFLEDAALVADADEYDASADAVTLITLHAAKGLEFGAVFLTGFEEGLCPHSRSFDNPDQMEEERRLVYVGLTRAKKRLFLSYAARRAMRGGSTSSEASRYLREIPRELIQSRVGAAGRFASARAPIPGLRPGIQPIVRTVEPLKPIRSLASGMAPADAALTNGVVFTANFKAGDRVRHQKFGEGIVVSCTPVRDDAEVVVAFQGLGVKKLLASLAGLTRP